MAGQPFVCAGASLSGIFSEDSVSAGEFSEGPCAQADDSERLIGPHIRILPEALVTLTLADARGPAVLIRVEQEAQAPSPRSSSLRLF